VEVRHARGHIGLDVAEAISSHIGEVESMAIAERRRHGNTTEDGVVVLHDIHLAATNEEVLADLEGSGLLVHADDLPDDNSRTRTSRVHPRLASRISSWLAARVSPWLAARVSSWLTAWVASWLASRVSSGLASWVSSWLAAWIPSWLAAGISLLWLVASWLTWLSVLNVLQTWLHANLCLRITRLRVTLRVHGK